MAFNHDNDTDGELMSEINVTPLVDVMLVLLVVFIITAPLLVPQSLKINLPRTLAAQQKESHKMFSLVVDARGNVELESQHVSDEALAALLHLRSTEPEFQLQIEADKAVPYGRIAELMALAQHAGVARLSFVSLAK